MNKDLTIHSKQGRTKPQADFTQMGGEFQERGRNLYEALKKELKTTRKEMLKEILLQYKKNIQVKKEEKVLKNLELIFNATLEISRKTGFQSMSVRKLSKKTGLSMGALYSYFPSKEKLLEMMMMHGTLIFQRYLGVPEGENLNARQKLHQVIQNHLYISDIIHPWMYFYYIETRYFTPEVKKKTLELALFAENALVEILTKGVNEDVYDVADIRLTASAMKSMVQDWYLKGWKYRNRQVTVLEYAQFVLEFLESAILAPGQPHWTA